jgi:hypothetical protein
VYILGEYITALNLVVINIYTGKAPEGALSQPEKNHQVRQQYLLTIPIHIFVECEDIQEY